jgi:hypothetical protein
MFTKAELEKIAAALNKSHEQGFACGVGVTQNFYSAKYYIDADDRKCKWKVYKKYRGWKKPEKKTYSL